MMQRPVVALTYQGCAYLIEPDIMTWLEIEDETGSLNALRTRLTAGDWRFSELLTVVQMLLAAAGCACDYRCLGDEIAAHGADDARRVVLGLLQRLLDPHETEKDRI